MADSHRAAARTCRKVRRPRAGRADPVLRADRASPVGRAFQGAPTSPALREFPVIRASPASLGVSASPAQGRIGWVGRAVSVVLVGRAVLAGRSVAESPLWAGRKVPAYWALRRFPASPDAGLCRAKPGRQTDPESGRNRERMPWGFRRRALGPRRAARPVPRVGSRGEPCWGARLGRVGRVGRATRTGRFARF